MTTRTDQPRTLSNDIIARIDAAIGCRQCGGSLDDSPSPDFCGEECQQTWHTARTEPLPAPISAPGWIELRDERTGEQMPLRELLPAATEVREVPTNASTGWIELGAVYEAVAEIVPRYGVPVIVAHQYATAHNVTAAIDQAKTAVSTVDLNPLIASIAKAVSVRSEETKR
jgi:hypothetical protein